MRRLTFALSLVGCLVSGVAFGRSAPPGIDPKAKDPCKNGCKMVRSTCDDECKDTSNPDREKNPAKCQAECVEREKKCEKDCPAVIKGKKTKEMLDKEDRAHQRGLDKPGVAPPMQVPMPGPMPDLGKAGVGG
jgi:hypothetical protein